MEQYSISLIIREVQIKNTTRYHLIPITMVIIKKPKITRVGENTKKSNPCAPLVEG